MGNGGKEGKYGGDRREGEDDTNTNTKSAPKAPKDNPEEEIIIDFNQVDFSKADWEMFQGGRTCITVMIVLAMLHALLTVTSCVFVA